jgi:uncharacterized membrane protein YhhN
VSAVVAAAATAVSVGALAGLVAAEARGSRRGVRTCKPIASAAFVAVAVALGSFAEDPYATLVLVGLVLAAGGDVALTFEGERAFLSGLALFLLGHVAYVVACSTRAPVGSWASPVALVPLAASAGAYAWLHPSLGRMRTAVVAYVLTITAMVVAALATLATDPRPGARWLLPAGALLFYASDLSVARDRFKRREFANRAWGLPAYYAGQLLLAWSVAPR